MSSQFNWYSQACTILQWYPNAILRLYYCCFTPVSQTHITKWWTKEWDFFFVAMSNKMDISSLNDAQSCWCGNEWKMFSFLSNNFVDFKLFCRLHFLCKSQFSTSEEEAGIYVLSSSWPTDKQYYLAPIPWTCKYRSLKPLISVLALMQAS